MIELPEAITLGKQVDSNISGKLITDVFPPSKLHKFTFFNGDPLLYIPLLRGKKVLSAKGFGIFVDISLTEDVKISINDGVNMQYCDSTCSIPSNYQLLITFDDESFLVFTVAMYGCIYVYTGIFENKYHEMNLTRISPLDEKFDLTYFERLFADEAKNISIKALLATGQRIPGIGNGVLQDILFNARINPRRKIASITNQEKVVLLNSIKMTLNDMINKGGRDTEKNLFIKQGGYKTILSKNTYKSPCSVCTNPITKESYMGGTVYYCPHCQII